MRTRILAGAALATATVVGPAAAPALAAPAPSALACEAALSADEVTTNDLGTHAAAIWSVQCAEDRRVKVTIDYVTGRKVVSETDVAAGEQWQALDFTPSPNGAGVNAVMSVYENGQLLNQLAINWD
ncbi:hypothetical protein [Actinomadura sp. 9N215]|uniref:hypothetical protein n=1 Tax=Actinomadura sp. 9N215 TaxID=3375150 RepID=UPI0037A401C6